MTVARISADELAEGLSKLLDDGQVGGHDTVVLLHDARVHGRGGGALEGGDLPRLLGDLQVVEQGAVEVGPYPLLDATCRTEKFKYIRCLYMSHPKGAHLHHRCMPGINGMHLWCR